MRLALGHTQLNRWHFRIIDGPGRRNEMKTRTKSSKVNKAWLNDHLNDPYVKLAQKEGYRARAAYKLKQIDEALGLIQPGHVVVDLGST
ncbi:MAG TPA: SAM-dependent methyltransferase, partial [Ramlibacter sp.]|nr:SAM-dependent methyltransferase [Ramlibacter sp.]